MVRKKTVLCIACFEYSLLVSLVLSAFISMIDSFVVFISTHKFYLLSFLLPSPLGGGKGKGELVAV